MLHSANTLGKDMNQTIFPLVMGKYLGRQIGIFHVDAATNLEEGKLNTDQTWRGMDLARLILLKTHYMSITHMTRPSYKKGPAQFAQFFTNSWGENKWIHAFPM